MELRDTHRRKDTQQLRSWKVKVPLGMGDVSTRIGLNRCLASNYILGRSMGEQSKRRQEIAHYRSRAILVFLE